MSFMFALNDYWGKYYNTLSVTHVKTKDDEQTSGKEWVGFFFLFSLSSLSSLSRSSSKERDSSWVSQWKQPKFNWRQIGEPLLMMLSYFPSLDFFAFSYHPSSFLRWMIPPFLLQIEQTNQLQDNTGNEVNETLHGKHTCLAHQVMWRCKDMRPHSSQKIG